MPVFSTVVSISSSFYCWTSITHTQRFCLLFLELKAVALLLGVPYISLFRGLTKKLKVMKSDATIQPCSATQVCDVVSVNCGLVSFDVVWCGVVWCGVVWCGVVWCGVVWCGVVWCGVVWCGVVWCGVVWCGVVWCGVVWCGVVWCGVVWCGVVCFWCGFGVI